MKCDLNSLLLSMIPIQQLVGFSFSWEQLCIYQARVSRTIFCRTVYSDVVMNSRLSTVEQTLDPMYSLNLSPMKTPSIGYRQGAELILNLTSKKKFKIRALSKILIQNKPHFK